MGTLIDDRADPDAATWLGSFEDAYVRHYDVLVRLAAVTTGSMAAAEDIVQDAFVDLYRRFPDVIEPAAWLRRAVTNRSTSWLRRRLVARRFAQRDDPSPIHPPPSDEDTAVRHALQALRPRQRVAIFLRYYVDLPETDIAEALGCRPGTVKSLLHRALSVLREHLDEA